MRKGSKVMQGGTVKTYKAGMSSGAKNTPGGESKANTSGGQPGRSGTKAKSAGSVKKAY